MLPAGPIRDRYRQEFVAELHGLGRIARVQPFFGLVEFAPWRSALPCATPAQQPTARPSPRAIQAAAMPHRPTPPLARIPEPRRRTLPTLCPMRRRPIRRHGADQRHRKPRGQHGHARLVTASTAFPGTRPEQGRHTPQDRLVAYGSLRATPRWRESHAVRTRLRAIGWPPCRAASAWALESRVQRIPGCRQRASVDRGD